MNREKIFNNTAFDMLDDYLFSDIIELTKMSMAREMADKFKKWIKLHNEKSFGYLLKYHRLQFIILNNSQNKKKDLYMLHERKIKGTKAYYRYKYMLPENEEIEPHLFFMKPMHPIQHKRYLNLY